MGKQPTITHSLDGKKAKTGRETGGGEGADDHSQAGLDGRRKRQVVRRQHEEGTNDHPLSGWTPEWKDGL